MGKQSEYRANQELSETPKRRNGSGQWVLLKSQILLVDVIFVAVSGITAIWFIVEFHRPLWEFFRYGGTLWNLLSAAIVGS